MAFQSIVEVFKSPVKGVYLCSAMIIALQVYWPAGLRSKTGGTLEWSFSAFVDFCFMILLINFLKVDFPTKIHFLPSRFKVKCTLEFHVSSKYRSLNLYAKLSKGVEDPLKDRSFKYILQIWLYELYAWILNLKLW